MPTPIPVAIFVDTYSAGGTQRQMIELLARLDRRRFKVHPVCFHPTGEWFGRVSSLAEPVAIFPIYGFRRPSTARRMRLFARWCREKDIAVLHTCELYSNIFGLYGGKLANVPVRIGSRRGFVEPPGLQVLQRAAYSVAHRVVANSQAAADRLRYERVADDKIVVIPNGIDLAKFPARQYSSRTRRIAMVACLREEKRIDVLINAAPRILERHPDVEFLLAGDGACREELVALANRLGVSDRVRFLGHRDDVPAVLKDADVFVLPSRSEAFPNSVMEAMASGLPVVATNVGGIPELVADGRTGRLVPPGDPAALGDALLDMVEHPDRAADFGRAGRRTIEERYSFERMVEQFEDLYLRELPLRQPAVFVPAGSRAKRVVKRALMNTYLASGYPVARDGVYARLGRGRLTVLNYHQVMDPADDYSSVSTAAFRQQMEFLKRNYRVVRLAEAVELLETPGRTDRLVSVTFDDGYLDNARTAAPILRELGLPACFFVSTEMIGGGRPFPHDVVQSRKQLHMDWSDVRELAAQGFDVGSHTCTHADMGAVSSAEAERELRESRVRLERELGRPVRLFAFPYGLRRNMRQETMTIARREYDVCCSAYGGHNTAPVDPGNVRRVVISTGVTFLAFRAVLEGWPMLRLANPYNTPHASPARAHA